MIETSILQNIWLTEVESKIYLTLLEKWSCNVTEISEYSGCNRVQIYDALPRLSESKIIGETIRWKRKYFFAESPENLENIFYEQKLSFENTIFLLKQRYEKKESKPELRTFYTREAMKHIFFDVIETLKPWETYYRYSSRKFDKLRGFLPDSYKKKRDEKSIQRMVITSDDLKKQKEEWKNILHREMAAIPKNYDLFDDNIVKIIYGNKVAIVDYNTETSFIVENRKFAEFEKKIFKLLFRFLDK